MRPTLLLLAFAALGCSDLAQMSGVPAFDCANPPADRVNVTARQLVQAFSDNLVSAEATYGGGKVLQVSGEASRVTRDDAGAFIGVRNGPLGKGKVQAYFPDANATEFGAVSEGQSVTVLALLKDGASTESKIALQSACLVSK